jgi:predicted CXXCH cytochrome family protein
VAGVTTVSGVLLLGVLFVGASPRLHAEDQCLVCHDAIEDKAARLFREDIHFRKGLGCADCHGGDPRSDDGEVAMSNNAGFRGVPKGDTITTTCLTCHGDSVRMRSMGSELPTHQGALLRASVHGVASTRGGERIVQCTTCHASHGIRPSRDHRSPVHPLNVTMTCARCHANPGYMRSYDPSIPVDQLEKYRTSRHGLLNAKGDAKAAECASCHGSHGIFAADDARSTVFPANLPATCAVCHSDQEYMKGRDIPTDQMDQYRSSTHGRALLERNDLAAPACNDCHGNHAATPPGIESISKVCGTCHVLNEQLFSESRHKTAFDELGLPECETCHGNHEIVDATHALLGTEEPAVCSQCHVQGEENAGFAFAQRIRFLVDSLDRVSENAMNLVEEAEQKGMEVSEARFRLREARQSRLEARTVIHSFNEEKTDSVLSRGLTTTHSVYEDAQAAIDEYYYRRVGLGVATLIITVLGVSLYVYIRRLEKAQQSRAASPLVR